jgi:RNA polymerase sigma factor (sigma-70 family)
MPHLIKTLDDYFFPVMERESRTIRRVSIRQYFDRNLSMLEPEQLKTWLVKVARKDAEAFRALYDSASPKLFGFALRILHKRELAEEVLQESFVSIWNNAASYQSSLAAPMTWMSTIVRNKAFDTLRKTDQTVEIDEANFDPAVMEALESSDPTPIEALQLSDQSKALARCFARLEGLHRQAIALAFFHDLSHSEVAEQMKLPIGTVKTWVRRGLARLKICLSPAEQS